MYLLYILCTRRFFFRSGIVLSTMVADKEDNVRVCVCACVRACVRACVCVF